MDRIDRRIHRDRPGPSETADRYTYVLVDGREADYEDLLAAWLFPDEARIVP